jgi:O-acetyl-ADP-ribose deacetylase (regulator of RNase III)
MIKYVNGDVTNPIGEGRKLVIQCVNDLGIMGAGVARAIMMKWPIVREKYIQWSKKDDFMLGNIQTVSVEPKIVVVNMIGQHGVGFSGGVAPIRYDAIEECLKKVKKMAVTYSASIHAPKFGAGLAGGDWDEIENILKAKLEDTTIEVTIYDYE